jgi:hypothetical protein
MAFKNDVADDVEFKNDVANDVALVWPRRAPRLATPFGHLVWPPRLATRRASRLAPRPALLGTPSGPVGHSV